MDARHQVNLDLPRGNVDVYAEETVDGIVHCIVWALRTRLQIANRVG